MAATGQRSPNARRTGPRFGYLVGRVDRIVRAALVKALEPAGLSITQYTVMSILAERPGLSNAQLARRSLVSPQAMNQAMAEPIARALVAREQDPDQGRILRMTLTDEGRRLLDMVDHAVDDVEASVLAALTAAERRDLLAALTTVADVEQRFEH